MCILLNWQIVHCILTCILFQLCTCSGLCQLLSNSCYILQKKKKKKKTTHTFVWVKNTKSYATKKKKKQKKKKKNPLSIFSLGKGGNPSSPTS